MLNLIGDGITKGAKKALTKATKEAGEEVAEKAAKTVAKKATRAEVLGNMAQELTEKYGGVAARKIGSYYGDGKMNSTLGKILRGEETQGPLLMYHATNADKLADLAKLGKKYGNKMPNPSLQVIDPNVNTGGNFGDIILLGNKDMAYPAGKYGGLDYSGKTNIYGRDIYSKRKPFVTQLEDGEYYFYPPSESYKDRVLATPENISKAMNKPPVRGSEGISGPGPIAAQLAPQFSSLSDVIENANRLTGKDKIGDILTDWNHRVFDAIDEMRRAQDLGVHVSNAEYMQGIQDLLANSTAKKSGFTKLPKWAQGSIYDNDTARAELVKLAQAGENLPTDYFELKANRPINMSEFSGAILPEDFGTRSWDTAEQEVMKFLEDNNIPVVDRYFVGADGSSERSKEAIFKKLARQDRLNTPYLMSLEPEFTPDYETRMAIDNLSNSVKRIGSKDVAPVDKKTLPVGWDKLEKRMNYDYIDNEIARLAGKSDIHDLTQADMKRVLDELGYEVDPDVIAAEKALGTYDEQQVLYNTITDAIDDQLSEEASMEGGELVKEFLNGRNGILRNKFAGPEYFYFGPEGRAGYLDAEFSDRLGIGRSNTPHSDDLNNYVAKDAAGDFFAGGIGIKPGLFRRGEDEVSTAAHERLHSFQNTAKGYDKGVQDAYNQLHEELAPYKLNKKQIKDYHGKLHGSSSLDYYLNDHEQEARMLQEYLDRAGYTKVATDRDKARRRFVAGRSEEFDAGIDKAFDNFFNKLRTLSKQGIALPVVGLGTLLGGSAIMGSNKKENG